MLLSRPSIWGPGLLVSGDENGQSSTSPARPVRALALSVAQHLTCLQWAHSSYPHLNSVLSSLLFSPCSEHRNHSCPLFSGSPGLCHGPLSPGGTLGFGWLVKSQGPVPSHMVQEAVSPGGLCLSSSCACCPPCVGCGEQVQKWSRRGPYVLGLSV